MTPISLSDIKKFPHILRELIEDLHEYPHLDNNSCLEECVSKLNEIYFLYEPSISSFCSGLTEATITDELAQIPSTKLEFILLKCKSIRRSMNLNLFDKIIQSIDDIILKLKSLESHLGVEFYSSYSESVDDSLKSYRVVAKEIKKESIETASTSGQILENIQKCIDDIKASSFDVPFIAVVGPSLMGKTQLAFILALIQPIIYLVFSNLTQNVYKNFSDISTKMKNLISLDSNQFSNISKLKIEDIMDDSHKYLTLGFLFAIYEISSTVTFNDQFDWMNFYLKMKSFTFTKLTVDEYRNKEKDLLASRPDMKRLILFIDEFEKQETIIFLRSLAQAARIPCILASTNASISNMLVVCNYTSRVERSPWCNVVSILPPCSLNGILKAIITSDGPTVTLSSYYSRGQFSVVRLLKDLKVKANNQQVKHILNLIKRQSKTCLQGMAFIVLAALIDILKNNTEIEDVWSKLIYTVSKLLVQRKKPLKKSESLYFSLSSFSLEPRIVLRNGIGEYKEGPASVSVNENLYFFGEIPESHQYDNIITLEKSTKEIHLSRETDAYTFKSYISNFSSDVLTHMILWNLLYAPSSSNILNAKFRTIADVILSYYNAPKSHNPENSLALKANHDFQEHLALLAIANASHLSFNGSIDGVSALKEFAIQVQVLSDQLSRYEISKLRDFISAIPPALEIFLSKIKLPYLIPQKFEESYLGNLVQTGVCKRLKDSEGIDISFEIRDRNSGYIECKNLKDNVSRSHVKKYALRAIKNKSPMTILLVNTAGSSIRSQKEFNSFSDNEKEEESAVEKKDEKAEVKIDEKEVMRHDEDVDEKETVPYKEETVKETAKKTVKKVKKVASREPNQKKTKTESERVIYSFSDEINRARIKDPSIPKNFDLNVYTLAYKDPKATDSLDLNFITLHEVEGKEPDGVFIIIESNAKFN